MGLKILQHFNKELLLIKIPCINRLNPQIGNELKKCPEQEQKVDGNEMICKG